jgi:excisionase family DNA binding protein
MAASKVHRLSSREDLSATAMQRVTTTPTSGIQERLGTPKSVEANPATGGLERQTYSVPEAARLLGVHKETLYKAIIRGEIKAIRIGRRTVISQAQLDALLAA